jgi:DNA helicase-2/ATP-dependent DNA helicase PcrA
VRNFKKYEYCVVDEAQDFSPLEYLVLNKLVLRGRFALFGDLNQLLEIDGVDDWGLIPSVIQDASKASKFELTENYRSTKQIIDYANKIMKPFTTNYLPKSIERVGSEVSSVRFNSVDEMVSEFVKEFSKEVESVKKSIGIIVYNDIVDFDSLKQTLSKISIDSGKEKITLLEPSKKINYTPKGVYLMRSDDCKGLEFSKVYVLGLNKNNIENFSEARKAFVAVTRAMNELVVYNVK